MGRVNGKSECMTERGECRGRHMQQRACVGKRERERRNEEQVGWAAEKNLEDGLGKKGKENITEGNSRRRARER